MEQECEWTVFAPMPEFARQRTVSADLTNRFAWIRFVWYSPEMCALEQGKSLWLGIVFRQQWL